MNNSPPTYSTRTLARTTARLYPAICFLFSLGIYYATLPRTITLEDAGLFQLVCHLGGISHPPGYPLYTLLCEPFVQTISFTNKVMAGNLLSALFASLAVAVFHHVCYLLKGRSFAWIASLAYAFSITFWSQAIIIEVYSLAVLMFVLCFWAALEYTRTSDIRYWYGLGFLYGLAVSNHWPMMILSTPALLVLLAGSYASLRNELTRPLFWVLSFLSLLLGLTPYISLMADPQPVISVYGGVHSLEQFYGYVTRSVYPDGNDFASYQDKLEYALWIVQSSLSQQGIWAAPFIFLGIAVAFRSMAFSISLAILFLYAGSTLLLTFLLNFEFGPFNRATFMPFPTISYLAVAMWFAFGLEGLKGFLEKSNVSRGLTRLVPFIAILLVLFSNYGRSNRSDDLFTEQYATTILESLPPDSTLFVYGDFESGLFGFLNLVKGVRPDVEIREWKNLVFSNRLISPFTSSNIRDEKIKEYIESTSRPVFSLSSRFSPATDFGLYHRFNPDGQNDVEASEKLDSLVAYLIRLHKDDLLSNEHERILNFQLLMNISRTYVNVVLQRGKGWELALKHLEELEDTFPGRFVMLEAGLDKEHLGADEIEVLLAVADSAEAQLPDMVDRKSLALFYEYHARLLLIQGVNKESAAVYFERSIQTYPSKENPSICRLRSLAAEENYTPVEILVRFREVNCE